MNFDARASINAKCAALGNGKHLSQARKVEVRAGIDATINETISALTTNVLYVDDNEL